MDDDTTKPPVEESNPSPDASRTSPQFFDVTPDLNISPISPDSVEEPVFEVPSLKADSGPIVVATPTPPTPPPPPPLLTPTAIPTPSTLPVSPAPLPVTLTSYSSISEAEKTLPGMSVIRTYEGDIASVITKKGTSTADMAMAEKKRETGDQLTLADNEPSHAGKKSFLAILSLILIVAGLIGAYYLYSISPLAPTVAQPQQQAKITSLIPSDSQTIVAVDGLSANQVIGKLQTAISKSQSSDSIEEIIPYTTDASGAKTRVTAQQMISLLDIPVPDMLTRSFTPSWMLGVYTDPQNNKSIFVVTVNNFFQNAFAGMLSWEKVMPDDLKQYLYAVVPAGVANAPILASSSIAQYVNTLQNIDSILPMTTTATSTSSTTSKKLTTGTSSTTIISTTTDSGQPVVPYFTLRGQFEDKIIKNKDVREFITVDGKALFLYSFIDNERLVITSNEETLAEIITRLENGSYVR